MAKKLPPSQGLVRPATAALAVRPCSPSHLTSARIDKRPANFLFGQAFVTLSRTRSVTRIRSFYSLYNDLIFPQVESPVGTVAQTSDVIPTAGYSS